MRRFLEFSLVTVVGLCLLPLVLGIIIGLLASAEGNLIYSQVRIGKDTVPFKMFKFRTLIESSRGDYIPSRFGKYLRSYSLDEIPQFINILNGSMTLVGPRPLPLKYLPHIPQRYHSRFSVTPGITGLAQVSGGDLSWDEKFDLDIYYVNSRSSALDIRILLRTITVIFSGRGSRLDEESLIDFYSRNEQNK